MQVDHRSEEKTVNDRCVEEMLEKTHRLEEEERGVTLINLLDEHKRAILSFAAHIYKMKTNID